MFGRVQADSALTAEEPSTTSHHDDSLVVLPEAQKRISHLVHAASEDSCGLIELSPGVR
jgi:hypothetical protein